MFDRIHQRSILSWVFFGMKNLFICYRSIHIFYFFLEFWQFCVSGNLPTSSRLSNWLAYNCSLHSLSSLFISVRLVVMSSLFLILLIGVFFVCVAKGLSILLYLFKHQFLISLILFIVFYSLFLLSLF